MSSLTLFNSSGSMPFLALSAVFSFVISAIFIGIVAMWMILKQKISDELSARDIKINTSITAEITKIKNEINTKIADDLSSRDGSITAEIERILNIKIANELSARLSEVNSTFTAELVRNNNELNKKLTAEIAKINSRDAGYVSEAQKILSMVDNVTTRLDNIEEACRNDFGNISSEFTSIKTSIEALRNEMIQRYAIAQRLQVEFDQQSVSNESEANSTNESETNSRGSSANSSSSSSGSSGSSQKFANIISVIREQFRDIFDRVKGANDYTLDQMCGIVSVDILSRLGMGVIGKDTIKGFYRGENLNSKNLEKIGAWIDNTHLHRY